LERQKAVSLRSHTSRRRHQDEGPCSGSITVAETKKEKPDKERVDIGKGLERIILKKKVLARRSAKRKRISRRKGKGKGWIRQAMKKWDFSEIP